MLKNEKTLIAFAVASALTLTACGSDNDDNVVVNPPEPPTPPVVVVPEVPAALSFVVSANVTDVATSNVIPTATLRFFEQGTDANVPATNVLDVNGNAVDTVALTDGSFAFTLKEGSALNSLVVLVSATGYVTQSFILDLSDKSASITSDLGLTSKSAAGVGDVVVEKAVSGGTSTEDVTAEVASGAAAASVTVPAGTIMQDSAGNAITGTKVALNVTTASRSSGAAAQITPQGMNAAGQSSIAVSVGVANIEMNDDTGKKITKFSSPINVGMTVPADLQIPSLGRTLQTGDELSISSYDETTAKWTNETTKATIGAKNEANNTFNATFATNHLTFFSLNRSVPTCPTNIRALLSGSAVPSRGLAITLNTTDATVSSYLRPGSTEKLLLSQGIISRYSISSDATARVRVYDLDGNVWFTTGSTEVNVCGDIPITLTNPNATPVNETFNVIAVCSNDTTKTTPITGAVVQYRLPNKGYSTATGGEGGAYSLTNLTQGSTYEVKVNTRLAGIQTATITADGTAETMNVSLTCNTTTGGN
ncbi:hypothetical protein ACFOEE_03035 [Pseudoalteromonas fenneropenaei]|uniref:Carboxypeptidase regulatory-like domain-containing protein n=1 Tax=Pseudoalteromonas fenneropenaei TaxID=1737459 RepID=A0ABV7CFZ8_9GAMM